MLQTIEVATETNQAPTLVGILKGPFKRLRA